MLIMQFDFNLQQQQSSSGAPLSDEASNTTEGPTASKKAATDRTILTDKKKPVAKDKKRTLKRL